MLRSYITGFLHLLFPRLCMACDTSLLNHEEVICTSCLYHLPFTDFHIDHANETARQLWGKLSFEKAFSMLHLAKSSRVELLLHRLKYKNQSEIGQYLGKMYALKLKSILNDIDLIVPIPLHKSKLRKRGYNQAGEFAKGLSEGSEILLDEHVLYREVSSVSQIQKDRMERYDNVKDVFKITSDKDISEKHILLVDDVLTTGATICEAGNLLLQAGAKVSVVTIARA